MITLRGAQRMRRAAAGALVAALILPATASAQDGGETADTDLTVTGHGWGHGRGMSQYGALGYAVDFGWSSEEILDHYYGGTTAGTVPNSILTVRIDASRDEPTIVTVDEGAVVIFDDDGNTTHVAEDRVLRVTALAGGGFELADGPTCAGPFVTRPGTVAGEELRLASAATAAGASAGPIRLSDGAIAGEVVVGDWDGDGDDDIGVVANGSWRLWDDGPFGSADAPDHTMSFGESGDTWVVGDWNGDGVDRPGIFDDGTWRVKAGLTTESRVVSRTTGTAGDEPLVGDWDGDGDDDLGVRRGRQWLLANSDEEGITIDFEFGRSSDAAIVGDWNGDGTDDPGVIRDRRWHRTLDFHETEDLPRINGGTAAESLVGDWDGDGLDTPATIVGGAIDVGDGIEEGDTSPRIDPNIPLEHSIQRCVSSTRTSYYRGELRAVHNDGAQRTVNAVAVESYLRAVVPLEMPASWALLGDGTGAEALQAQAVSARSYALAENRTSYARTCDTISCQVYGGRATRNGDTITSNEHPLADAAILATAGLVRSRDGEVARTEFSSSTGGWTAGGVFPAVEDLGDGIDRNPNHDWTVSIAIATVEQRWGGRQLDQISVTERNGLGEDGGRVETVELRFGDEVFTMTGNEFRRAFGLKSDWFTVDWARNAAPDRRDDCICPEAWPTNELDDAFG